MPESNWRLPRPSSLLVQLTLVVIVLVALFLRTYQLDHVPPGPFGDEAIVAILSGEIATGRSFPIFVQAYTGNEVLFFYLAAVMMRLVGISVLATRLTSALIGTGTVVLAYVLARELFDDEPLVEPHWLGLFSAALMATSFWHISVSRYGFRAITLPLVQSLMLFAIWRGLRHNSWNWIAAAGVFCGLTAYTYLSSRIVPIALALIWLMVLVSERQRWRLRLAQLGIMTIVALVVFAPLGIFFATHPGSFSARTDQLSIFAEGSTWQATLIHNTLRALEVFTSRGDPQLRFNLPDLPMFQGWLALAFYGGLAVLIARLMRPSGLLGRVRYVLLAIWPLAMLIPSILAQSFEVPHSLRSMGIMPLIFFVPALGLVALATLIRRVCAAQHRRMITPLVTVLLACVFGGTAIITVQNYFARWATLPRLYYENYADIADMARYLDTLPDDGRALHVSAPDYRYPSAVLLTHRYQDIKWVQGAELFAFAPGPAIYAWPRSSLPDDWWLAQFFPMQTRIQQGAGPDGEVAYIVHALDRAPDLVPSHPLSATFGGVIQAIGYDVLRDRPSGGRTDVAVYWRILRRPDRGDYSEFLTLQDAWGITWGQGGSFAYPSEQWSPGEIIAERVRIQTDDGTPPGSAYSIKLGWWSATTGQRLSITDAQGQFAGTTITVGPITVTRRTRPLDVNTLNISQRLNRDIGGLMLLGYDQWPASIRQGESEFVTLYWQARSIPLPDRTVTLQLRGSNQQVIALSRSGAVHGIYPTSQWEQDEFIADQLALRIPSDTPPGSYTLEALVDDFPIQSLGHFDVQAIQRTWTPPTPSRPMSVTLGEQVALVGYDLQYPTPALRAGASVPNTQYPIPTRSVQPPTIEVTLHWQALREMNESNTVFVHLVDASGAVRAQKDNLPVNDTYPTTLWQPGEFVRDIYTLSLPSDLPPGEYTLEVGMYLADTGARLVTVAGKNHIALETMNITP